MIDHDAGLDEAPGEALDEAQATRVIRDAIGVRSASALEHVVLDAIASGELPPGTRLPTVRALAEQVGMSSSAVGQAWSALREASAVVTRRRGGTTVLGSPQWPRAKRFHTMDRATQVARVDLANLRGDLLPRASLEPAWARAVSWPRRPGFEYARAFEPEFVDAARQWSQVDSEAQVATHGLPDAVELFLMTNVKRGEVVVVDSPTHPRILDVIDLIGAFALPLRWGRDGPDLGELSRAMGRDPIAMIVQTMGGVPSGRSVTAAWCRAAAQVLGPSSFPILEIDQFPMLDPPARTMTPYLPGRVARLESYTFYFGIDLRIALISGAAAVVDPLISRLTYSTRYVSPIQQFALAHLLTDAEYRTSIDGFNEEAIRRTRAMTRALQEVGFEVESTDAPSIWVPVADELETVLRLRDDGILVYPGSYCIPRDAREPQPRGFLHVGGPALSEGHRDIARRIAAAASL